jgi:hypothetical protein
VLHKDVRKGIGACFELDPEKEIGVMMAQFLIHEGSRKWLGQLRAQQDREVSRQVLAKKNAD